MRGCLLHYQPYTRSKRHFNESWLTSKCPKEPEREHKGGHSPSVRLDIPAAVGRIDKVPLRVPPLPQRSGRLVERPFESGELLERRGVDPPGIRGAADQAVALGAS